MRVIQKAIQSKLSCEQKISYLSEMLGRIQSAVSMKSFAIAQLAVIVEGSQIEIGRLGKQLEENNRALEKLGLGEARPGIQVEGSVPGPGRHNIDLENAYYYDEEKTVRDPRHFAHA